MSPPLGLKLVIIFLLLTCRPTGAMAGNHIDIIILLKPRRGGMSIAKALSHTLSPVGATYSYRGRCYKQHFHPPFVSVYRHECFICFNLSLTQVPIENKNGYFHQSYKKADFKITHSLHSIGFIYCFLQVATKLTKPKEREGCGFVCHDLIDNFG